MPGSGLKRKRTDQEEEEEEKEEEKGNEEEQDEDFRPAKAPKLGGFGPHLNLAVDLGGSLLSNPDILPLLSLRHLALSSNNCLSSGNPLFHPPRPLGAPLHEGPIMERAHPVRVNSRAPTTDRTSETGADRAYDLSRLVDHDTPARSPRRGILKRPREETLGEVDGAAPARPVKAPRTLHKTGKEVHFDGRVHTAVFEQAADPTEIMYLGHTKLPRLPRGRVPDSFGRAIRTRMKTPAAEAYLENRHNYLFCSVQLVHGRPIGRPLFNYCFERWLREYCRQAVQEAEEKAEMKSRKKLWSREKAILRLDDRVEELQCALHEMENELTAQVLDRPACSTPDDGMEEEDENEEW